MSNTKTTPSSIVPAAAEIVDSKPPNGTAKNALTHGAYAQEIVIDGESVEEFNNLHESLGDELQKCRRALASSVCEFLARV